MNILNYFYLDKKYAVCLYYILKTMLFLCYLIVIYYFLLDIYDDRHSYMKLIDPKNLSIANTKNEWSEYTEFFKLWGMNTVYLILKLILISFISFILDKFPVPSYWLNLWEKDNQINSILGRKICNHIRNNRYLNFISFININNEANKIQKNIHYIKNNDNLINLFNKYDTFFQDDK